MASALIGQQWPILISLEKLTGMGSDLEILFISCTVVSHKNIQIVQSNDLMKWIFVKRLSTDPRKNYSEEQWAAERKIIVWA